MGPVPFTYSAEVFTLPYRETGMSWAVAVSLYLAGHSFSRHAKHGSGEQRLRSWPCNVLPADIRQLPSARCGCILLLRGPEHRFYGSDLSTHARDEDESLER